MSGEWGRGGPWGHKSPLTALVEAVWRKSGTAARTRFHPKTEGESTGWKYSRRKNRRFCCADSLTTSRSAGSCGILKERCSTHEIAAMTLFSAKFGCLLRSAECRWGVPGLLRHESPFKECVAENKTRIPIRQTNCYFSDSRRRVPWLLSQHRDMLFR